MMTIHRVLHHYHLRNVHLSFPRNYITSETRKRLRARAVQHDLLKSGRLQF